MSDQSQRTADLVELHALCARYMAYTSQFVQDRWLDVFTPDVEYNAFGTPYTLERFPALLAAAPRGQFIGNMPVVELDGDRATGDAALRVHRSADARDAPRLVPRRVRAHAPTAGASGAARPRSCARAATSTPGVSTTRSPTQ